MDDIPLPPLFAALVFLIVLSGFFSGAETALMRLNRYRLRHRVKEGHPGAQRAARLLERPDRLIGVILLGNNFVNILASALATVVALRLMGEAGIAVAAGVLTLVILIFAEVAPKTVAALHPERLAYPASYILGPLLRLLYPLVWAVNGIANGLLRLAGINPATMTGQALSRDELRTVVSESNTHLTHRHQRMLISILDLERATVEDIMIPRNEIVGIDLDDSWRQIMQQLAASPYTRLPVYRENIDNVSGFIHAREVLRLVLRDELQTKEDLERAMREPYFIPENTPLNTQLANFQRQQLRIGLVVDEYGDIMGLATLEDLLEEIVGEFTTDPSDTVRGIQPQADGSYLVDGGVYLRELNRTLHTSFPLDGPKTVNGLVLEHLEAIPEGGTRLILAGYPVEVIQTSENAVRLVRVTPHREPAVAQDPATQDEIAPKPHSPEV